MIKEKKQNKNVGQDVQPSGSEVFTSNLLVNYAKERIKPSSVPLSWISWIKPLIIHHHQSETTITLHHTAPPAYKTASFEAFRTFHLSQLTFPNCHTHKTCPFHSINRNSTILPNNSKLQYPSLLQDLHQSNGSILFLLLSTI